MELLPVLELALDPDPGLTCVLEPDQPADRGVAIQDRVDVRERDQLHLWLREPTRVDLDLIADPVPPEGEHALVIVEGHVGGDLSERLRHCPPPARPSARARPRTSRQRKQQMSAQFVLLMRPTSSSR